MCKIIDDALPVIGAVGGTLIGGPLGGALGAGLGGAIGNYTQTHNFGDALGAGAISGGTSAISGGLANGLGAAGAGLTSAGAGATGDTLGGLESGLGGGAMFGANAGTGTALGNGLAGSLGGSNLGIAGGDALSGVTSNGFTGALGGTAGSGLGGGTASDASNLNGVMNQTSSAPTSSTSQGFGGVSDGTSASGASMTAQPSPVAALSNNQLSPSMEGAQVGSDQGSLSSLYGPNSATQGSIAQQGVADSATPVTGQVAANTGTLGQSSGGLSSMFGGTAGNGTGVMGSGLQTNDLLNIGKVGLDAYQQHARQSAANGYANQIDQEFSPNSAYAQQMQQTLARQDAAAGRNSQGGTRAVQLAAALTQAHANAMGNSQYANARQNTSGSNMLNGIFNTFSSPQGQQSLKNIGSAGFNGLSSLFGG